MTLCPRHLADRDSSAFFPACFFPSGLQGGLFVWWLIAGLAVCIMPGGLVRCQQLHLSPGKSAQGKLNNQSVLKPVCLKGALTGINGSYLSAHCVNNTLRQGINDAPHPAFCPTLLAATYNGLVFLSGSCQLSQRAPPVFVL